MSLHQTDELPIVIEAGGPTEADERVTIEESECGICGYDRVKVHRKHGEASTKCMYCDATKFSGGDWTPKETDRDELESLREYAERDESPIVKYGESRTRSTYNSRRIELFGYEDSTNLYMLFKTEKNRGTEKTTLFKETLYDALKLLEDDHNFVTEFVDEALDTYQVGRDTGSDNPNAIHIGEFTFGVSNPHKMVTLVTKMQHEGLVPEPFIVHFPPSANGVHP